MFNGQSEHTCDQKGRVIIPAKHRSHLSEDFFITRGFEGCLFIYSAAEWGMFLEKLTNTSDFDKNARRIQRIFSSGAEECGTDKQGRVCIPAHLREYAGIEPDASVTIIGAINHLEIWNSDKWKQYLSGDEAISLEEAGELLK